MPNLIIESIATGERWSEDELSKFLQEYGEDCSGFVRGWLEYDGDVVAKFPGWRVGYIYTDKKSGDLYSAFFFDPATYRVFDEAREAGIRKVLKAEYEKYDSHLQAIVDTGKAYTPDYYQYLGKVSAFASIARALNINLEEPA